MFSFTTRARAVALALTCSVAVLAAASTTHAAAPDREPPNQEHIAALVKPSIVYIGVTWDAFVGGWAPADLPEKSEYWSPEISVSSVCTGFVVDSAGYVVTAGHCVDPDEVRNALIDEALEELVAEGSYTRAQVNSMRRHAYNTWELEGFVEGSSIERSIDVYPTEAASGIAVSRAITAKVVEFRSLTEGDAALLKIQSPTPLASLELAGADPDTGAAVTSAGYPASVGGIVDSGADPSFKTGWVSSHQVVDGAPFVEIDAAMSQGMSGGPTVDAYGRVIGANSWNPALETQSFNFVTSNSTLRELLARNGVDNDLSQADRDYRTALDDYYAGDFGAAIDGFDRVLDAIPAHAQAQVLRGRAVEALDDLPDTVSDDTNEQSGESDALGAGIGASEAVGDDVDVDGDRAVPTTIVADVDESSQGGADRGLVVLLVAVLTAACVALAVMLVRLRAASAVRCVTCLSPIPSGQDGCPRCSVDADSSKEQATATAADSSVWSSGPSPDRPTVSLTQNGDRHDSISIS
ncbi:MAG: hypothetical protein CL424_10150 [Acidimicrobiaceae bacterium]|nr:hypothetical protein [Acidimicrobiaceae bacterium]